MKLLYVGPLFGRSELARAGSALLPNLQEYFDVQALCPDYTGDPHTRLYPVWPAPDGSGCLRFWQLVQKTKADAVLAVGWPWHISPLLWQGVAKPVHAWTALPAENFSPEFSRRLDRMESVGCASEFAAGVFGDSWCEAPRYVARPGVDERLFSPVERPEARERVGMAKELPPDAFVAGALSLNEPWARVDLAVMAFAKALPSIDRPAYLYVHDGNSAAGCDVKQLADHLGVAEHIVVPKPGKDVATESLRWLHGAFDVGLTTSLGESLGLTIREGLACGIPQIAPDGGVMTEILGALPAARLSLVPTSGYQVMPGGPNLLGRVVDVDGLAEALVREAGRPVWREKAVERSWAETAREIATEIRGKAERRAAA